MSLSENIRSAQTVCCNCRGELCPHLAGTDPGLKRTTGRDRQTKGQRQGQERQGEQRRENKKARVIVGKAKVVGGVNRFVVTFEGAGHGATRKLNVSNDKEDDR